MRPTPIRPRALRHGLQHLWTLLLGALIVMGGRQSTALGQPADSPGPGSGLPTVDQPASVDQAEATESATTRQETPELPQDAEPENVAGGTGETSDQAVDEAAETEEEVEEGAADDEAADDEAAEEAEGDKTEEEGGDSPQVEESEQEAEQEAEPEPVGEPLAASMVSLLQQEIVAGLKKRGIQDDFVRFQKYAAYKLNSTSRSSGSELKGNCRLSWYDHLLRNPLKAPAEAQAFTRELHQAVLDNRQGLARALAIAAEKLDLTRHAPQAARPVASAEQALELVEQCLIESQLAYSRALAPLSKSEIGTLTSNLYPILTSQNRVGHTLQSRGTGRRLCDLMEKLDRTAMHAAVEALAPLAAVEALEQLASLSPEGSVAVEGVTGTVVRRIDTPGGSIVIGGPQQNAYQLDRMPGVSVVIDLGGDDTYAEGTVSLGRPVLVVIDLGGSDRYRGSKPGVQGSGILGISMLLDLSGDDVYQAQDVAQGSCLAGGGILIDYAGNDTYVGLRRVQGQALGGVGILIDRAGNDRYHAAMWGQGLGGPLGFGLLDDLDGKDHYYGGGLYLNSYLDDENPTPGYEGWVQGMGAGLRAVANGGVGVILDGGGDDVYEYDYLSHGGGYWCGTGFARDFGGNDQRLGATRKAYNGSSRTQRDYQRFGSGYGCHYALGFLFDDRGNDTYNGTIMCVGYAWDCAVGYLCDFGGDDSYSGTEGNGAQAGLGVLFDYAGNDAYLGYGQGRASSGISYHDLPQCGGNFGFVIDYGGTDKYGCGARNNSYNRRSSSGGFLIDRPKRGETQKTAHKVSTRTAAGS
ncbi:MAG: hypothetical protein JXB62_08990 [Pirellulales bacterium]|nr:hypothetical protein [Pirellulales bacterium]